MSITGLIFDYGWRKPIIINFNGKETEIELVFDAYKGENVNSVQETEYNEFVLKQTHYEEKIVLLLNEYIKENNIVNASVTAKTLLFNNDGSFGLLCDCSWDIENGIAIILSPESKVTIQDEFI